MQSLSIGTSRSGDPGSTKEYGLTGRYDGIVAQQLLGIWVPHEFALWELDWDRCGW